MFWFDSRNEGAREGTSGGREVGGRKEDDQKDRGAEKETGRAAGGLASEQTQGIRQAGVLTRTVTRCSVNAFIRSYAPHRRLNAYEPTPEPKLLSPRRTARASPSWTPPRTYVLVGEALLGATARSTQVRTLDVPVFLVVAIANLSVVSEGHGNQGRRQLPWSLLALGHRGDGLVQYSRHATVRAGKDLYENASMEPSRKTIL